MYKSVPFTEKRPRRPETGTIKMVLKKWNTNFCLEYSILKNRLPFQMFRCSWKFSAGTTQKVVFHLLFNRVLRKRLACENIRFSSLFVVGDVSRGGTSAIQRQKFHTDDLKSVRNPVRSADWSTEQLHFFSNCLRMTDKKKATKVKCKR